MLGLYFLVTSDKPRLRYVDLFFCFTVVTLHTSVEMNQKTHKFTSSQILQETDKYVSHCDLQPTAKLLKIY